MRILFAEDERDLLNVAVKRLKAEGFGVDGCSDGEEALDYIESTDYDLIILDIMMPKADGLTVLRKIRRAGNNVPVLLLTAKDAVSDRVEGLDAGADDYLTKPYAFSELLARIRALLRRQGGVKSDVLTAGDLVLELSTKKGHESRDGDRALLKGVCPLGSPYAKQRSSALKISAGDTGMGLQLYRWQQCDRRVHKIPKKKN